jgi:hypothetical protein
MPPAASTSTSSEPRLSVSADGALIAHVEDFHIALLDGESLTGVGEIGIDPDAEGCDVALCGEPLRLVVLSRYASNARLHVIDPVGSTGPTAVGELALRAPMRLAAASGDHVWLQGGGGATLVDVAHRELVLSPLALRAPVSAVGAHVSGRFVVSTGGLIEEWDAENRAPARRFRLARPLPAQFVGGGARQVWKIPADGDRVDIVPLVNVGQPTRIELPEPPVRVAADASHEAIVILGARTGTAYLIDLTGKTPPAPIEGADGTDLAWLGPNQAIVVASVGSAVEVVPVSAAARASMASERAAAPAVVKPTAAPRASMLTPASGATAVPVSVSATKPGSPPAPVAAAVPAPAAVAAAVPAPAPAPATASAAVSARAPRTVMTAAPAAASRTIAAGRAPTTTSRAAAPPPPPARKPAEPAEAADEWFTPPAPPTWRDQLATWAQAVLAGTRADAPTISGGPAALIAERLGLAGDLAEALWFVYGAHLAGVDGVGALDLTQIIGRRWDEALGQGRLAAAGALRWRRSRIRLRREVRAALDEAPPIAGAWIESAAASPAHPVAVIADDDVDPFAIALWLAPQLGPLLVDGARPRPHERVVLEARVRGGLAVLRWPPADLAEVAAPLALLIVADDEAARVAQAPVVATWPAR